MTSRLVAIQDIAQLNPRIPEAVRALRGSSVAFVPMAAVSEGGGFVNPTVRPAAEVLKGYTYFEEGDILLAKITPCFENGKTALAQSLPARLGFASTEFHVLRPGAEIEPRYLLHVVSSRRFRAAGVAQMTGSAGQKRVPADFVSRFKFALPPLAEQRRIAGVLDRILLLTARLNEAIRTLPQLSSARLHNLLVGHRDGLPEVRLEEIGEVSGGLQVTQARAGCALEVPYLRVANVYRDRLVLDEVKLLKVTPQERDRATLSPGDILVVEGHGNPEEIGRAAVWNGEIDGCVHQNHLIRVQVDHSVARPVYVSAFLNSPSGRRQFARFGKTTSGLNTISTTNVRAVRLPLPCIDEQVEFETFARGIQSLASKFNERTMRCESLLAVTSENAFGVAAPIRV